MQPDMRIISDVRDLRTTQIGLFRPTASRNSTTNQVIASIEGTRSQEKLREDTPVET